MCLRNAVGVCARYERMKDRETENEIEQECGEREMRSLQKQQGPYFPTTPPSNHLHFYVSYLIVDNPFV